MDRDEFMECVYDELSDDADNYRANRIIDAADEYARSYAENILPVPCTKFQGLTVKEWFAKINEELDEFKAEALRQCTCANDLRDVANGVDDDTDTRIIEEATDVITVITSMLEAMGIDEDMRQKVQREVNAKNKRRGYY